MRPGWICLGVVGFDDPGNFSSGLFENHLPRESPSFDFSMNYFAHALPYLDRPYFLAGTGVPDWLTVADRPVRLRSKHVEPFQNDSDPVVAAVAGGILQHLRDDSRFHASRAFVETSLAMTVIVRDVLEGETGLRPAFLGHLLVEMLLDASLIADNPVRLTEYYRVLDAIDPDRVEAAVNSMAPRPTQRLALFIELFLRERILWDYLEDGKLWIRLNQVMRRVKQEPLPNHFLSVFATARKLVTERRDAMLEGILSQNSDA
jgi:hypothetical protein